MLRSALLNWPLMLRFATDKVNTDVIAYFYSYGYGFYLPPPAGDVRNIEPTSAMAQ